MCLFTSHAILTQRDFWGKYLHHKKPSRIRFVFPANMILIFMLVVWKIRHLTCYANSRFIEFLIILTQCSPGNNIETHNEVLLDVFLQLAYLQKKTTLFFLFFWATNTATLRQTNETRNYGANKGKLQSMLNSGEESENFGGKSSENSSIEAEEKELLIN